MKKILILTTVFSLGLTTIPAFSQSFLKKTFEKVDKVFESADKALNGKSSPKQEGQTAAQPAATASANSTSQNRPLGYMTDLEKHNLDGRVKTVVETRLWDGDQSVFKYTYTPEGMVEEYTCEDGVVRCKYSVIYGVGRLAHREIELSTRDYAAIDWDGKQYMESEMRAFYDDDKGRPGKEVTMNETVVYTYPEGGKIVRADFERENTQTVPTFYVYDNNGRISKIYMEKIDDCSLVQEFKYDDKGRKTYEKSADGTINQYKYNDNNDVVYSKTTNTFGHDEDSESQFTYSYDAAGNWIEKTWKSGGETVATYKRTIEYYK